MEPPVKCKICSSEQLFFKDITYRVNKLPVEYLYCGNCGFLSKAEKHILSPEREREDYLTHHNTLENLGYVEMLTSFIDDCITPYIQIESGPPLKILDFGSGPGPVLAHLLRERGYEVDIYDPYFAPGTGYREKTYNIITATEVFEHTIDPQAVMQHLASRLAPGGLLAITTHFHPIESFDPGAGIEKFLQWWYRREITHISFFRPGTLCRMAGAAGLEVVKILGKNRAVFRLSGVDNR